MCRVSQNHAYVRSYIVCTTFLAHKRIPCVRSDTGCVDGPVQPHACVFCIVCMCHAIKMAIDACTTHMIWHVQSDTDKDDMLTVEELRLLLLKVGLAVCLHINSLCK
jgi:hypothetical protein